MPNSTGSFKKGEKVLFSGDYECLHCRQLEKTTVKALAEGALFPHCDVCGTKSCTYRIKGERPAR